MFTFILKTRTGLSLLAFALVAFHATVAVRAQQSPATTPATGAAAAPRVVRTVAAPAQVTYAAPKTYVAPQPTGDPYGFTGWLNGVRASYGLGAVGYDPNLSGWASQNNAQQNARGLGHFVMGPARRQNSAVGNYASIGAMWLASPAHRAALLDPSIRWIGIAGAGAYWTFNAN